MVTIEARLLDSIDDGFVAIDSACRVSYCNEAAAGLLAIDEMPSLVGRDLFDAAPSLRGTPAEIDVHAAMTQSAGRRSPALHVVDDRIIELLVTPLSDGGFVLQFTDITHRVERDRQMAEDLLRLEHDLRNPLAPLRTSLELLNRSTVAEATKERARTIMGRQLDQMVSLIERLHDLANGLRDGEGTAGRGCAFQAGATAELPAGLTFVEPDASAKS